MDQLKKIATFEFDGEDEMGDKYEQWSFQMENLFALDGLESVLDLSEGASQPSVENSAKVFAKLAISCTGKALREVRRVPRGDGRAAWLALKNRFASKRDERVVALSVEVLSLQWEAYGNLDSFYEAISGRYDKLVATGSNCIPSESLVIAHICKQLPAKYGPIIVKQFSDTKANTIHEFFELLRLFETSTKSEEKGGSEVSYVVKGKGNHNGQRYGSYGSNPSQRVFRGNCYSCGQKGHMSRNCPKNASKGNAQQDVGNNAFIMFNGWQQSPAVAFNDSDIKFDIEKHHFCVDSGCTRHICATKELFSLLKMFTEKEKKPVVKVANKELVSAAGIGEVEISVRNHCGKLHDITLKEVLFIPNASVNLLSTEKLTRDESGKPTGNVFIHGAYSSIRLKHAHTVTVIPLKRQFGLLWLVPEIFHSFNAMSTDKTVSVDMQLLHERLGHLNRQDLLKLPNCTLGIKMTDSKLSFCDSCAVSKSKRQPVNWKARERHTKPGQLIHTDINGPMQVASLKGMRYIVCFIDDATRYSVIYLMKAKSEVLDCFKQYIDYMRVRQVTVGTGSTLQSDNDTVYRDKHFSNFCGSLGIDQRFSAPHTQAQNGVAERFWNTIVDAARTMLHSAKLPKSYWGLAVKHATMLRNVSPSSALSGMTPFECVYGYKPNLATLRKFGSHAYVNTPKDQRKKWDNKACVGIYVGEHEQSKTHLIYMQSTNSIIESMHVKFDEFYDKQHHKDKVQHSSCSIDGNDFEGEKGDQQNQEEERVEQNQEEERVEQNQEEERVEQNQEEERVDNEENQEVEHQQDDTVGKRELILTRSRALKRGLKLVDLPGGNVKVVNSGEDHQSTDDDGDDISSPSCSYFLDACYTANLPSDPTSLSDALESPQSEEWKKAINEEYQSLVENNTWTLVPASSVPKDRKPLTNKVVFKTKYNADGTIAKRKARLVVKGYSQKKGIDYDEVFAPVAHHETIRTLLAVSAARKWFIHQMDVKTAFLNPILKEEIYMAVPEGMNNKGENGELLVCKLNKSLYGLKQASKCWNDLLHQWMVDFGFNRCYSDPCLYILKGRKGQEESIYVAVWVDDLIIACKNQEKLHDFKKSIARKFKMTDLGSIQHCLGMRICYNLNNQVISIDQEKYIEDLLEKFSMHNCKPVATPLIPNSTVNKEEPDISLDQHVTKFQELIGSLMYLVTCTRPDIAAAVGQLARVMSQPSKLHWSAAKHVLRYLKGTKGLSLTYGNARDEERENLIGFSDANFGGDSATARSTTGYVFILNGAAVSWKSKLQSVVALSTAEAEYMALCETVKEAVYLQQLLEEIGLKALPVTIYEDNQPCIHIASNPVTSNRSKHIAVRYHYVREVISNGKVQVLYKSTQEMVADCLTKNLAKDKVEKFRSILLGMS